MGVFMGVANESAVNAVDDMIDEIYELTGLMPVDVSQEERVDLLMAIHFPCEKFRCHYCVDHIDGLCAGKGLKGYKQVKRCMSEKALSDEMQIFY